MAELQSNLLLAQSELPLLIEATREAERAPVELHRWINEQRVWLDEALLRHGGLLFRGFALEQASDFEAFCRCFDPTLLRYVGGESPRSAVTDHVYTSTEYPAHLEISLHNEMSYARVWPSRLFFFCATPPAVGGETHLADGRRILAALDPAIRERFASKGVTYLRNLQAGGGLGKSWQDTFETSDRAAVEAHCRENGIDFEWTDSGLRTRAVRPALKRHPRSGEEVWFNQADQFHISSRGPRLEKSLLQLMDELEVPRHAFFGDGSPISREDLAGVRQAYRESEILFSWQGGDVLVLDNVLAAHGRKPFEGERKILVAMS